MSEPTMTTSQAIGVLRRASQTLRFVEQLEQAARHVTEREEQLGALDEAMAHRRKQLAEFEQTYNLKLDEALAEKTKMDADLEAARREHAHQLLTLEQTLADKEQAVAQACTNEDQLYLEQCHEHQARIEALQATIAEREGYLQNLQGRIGALRADFDLIRGA